MYWLWLCTAATVQWQGNVLFSSMPSPLAVDIGIISSYSASLMTSYLLHFIYISRSAIPGSRQWQSPSAGHLLIAGWLLGRCHDVTLSRSVTASRARNEHGNAVSVVSREAMCRQNAKLDWENEFIDDVRLGRGYSRYCSGRRNNKISIGSGSK